MASMVMTKAQWRRVVELPERIRVRDERNERRREKSDRQWRERLTEADHRLHAWMDAHPRHAATIGPYYAAKMLRIPVDALLQETRGAAFRLDFGRRHDGRMLTLFYFKDLVRFAKARLRGEKAGRPLRRAA